MFGFKTTEATWPPGFSLPPSSSHRMTLVTQLPVLGLFLLLGVHNCPSSPVWLSVLVWKYCMWRNLLACMVLSVLKEEGPHLASGWLRHRKCGNTGKVEG